MDEHTAEESNKKYFSPCHELRQYLVERLKLAKRMNELDSAGAEIPTELFAKDRSLRTKKVRILDDIIFQAMADLTYFFGCIAEHPELRDIFDSDIKDLLGLKHNSHKSQRAGYGFSRLIRSILIADKKMLEFNQEDVKRKRREDELSDYRLILTDLLQQAVQDKIRRPMSTVMITQDAVNNVLNDFSKARGWTIMLKHHVDQGLANEVPHRIFDFDPQKSLIILRGPAGSGKTSVCDAIMQKIGKKNSCKLDLDITYPQEDKFKKNLMNCLSSDNVIGMMFCGNSHTNDPLKWITKFREKDYRILSVILYASKETCFNRCRSDNNTGRHPINKEKGRINKYYDEFYERENNRSFAEAAGIVGVTVNTENKSPEIIAHEILEKFNEMS
jgi:predicted ABC-type ATPase